jgi:hypothetical protein
MPTTPRRLVTPEQRQRENRLIATTLAFVALGPPIGMLTMFSLSGASEMLKGTLNPIVFVLDLGAALLYAPWSYLFGAIPAGIAGALVAYLSISNRFSWWFVLLIGSAVGLLWFFQIFLFPLGGDPRMKFDLRLAQVAAAHIAICMVPTILCTAIVRHYERKWCRTSEAETGTAA